MREEMERIGERIAEQAAHIDAAMHSLLADIRTFDAAGGWHLQGALTCAHWLSWRIGWGLGTAREHLRVARALGELPLLDDALRRGAISYSKVRAMTRVATPENEGLLLDYATHAPAAQLETICRKFAAVQRLTAADPDVLAERREVCRRAMDDGMQKIDAILRPDEAALVWKAVERAMRDVPAGTRSRADGLVALAQAYLRGDEPARAPVEVVVTVSAAALAGSSDEPGVTDDRTHVPAETCRRLSCDAAVVAVVEGKDGEVLSVGRRSRTIPAAIHRAMLHRDEHRCRFPGCTAAAYLDGHHVRHWANGGETRLDNLLTLCGHHHAFVHEQGYRIELDAAGAATFFDPRGRVVLASPPRPAGPEVGWRAILDQHADLDISAETNLPGWDGRPADVGAAVSALALTPA